MKIGRSGCTIATGDAALRLDRIELPTAERMPMSQFCRESGLAVGDRVSEAATAGEGLCMPLVSFSELMTQAEAGGYAVGYFESWNLESLLAVVDAAEAAQSPVILGFSGIYLGASAPRDGRSAFGVRRTGTWRRAAG